MSFSADVKVALCQEVLDEAAAKAQLAALFFCRASLHLRKGWGVSYASENAAIAKHVFRLLKQLYGFNPQIRVLKKMRFYKTNTYSVQVDQASELLVDLGILCEDGFASAPKMYESEEEKRSFLQGCFLASGSINDPSSSNYHLELSCQEAALADYIHQLLLDFYFPAKLTTRKGLFIIYIKAGDKIADFLRLINATQALLDFENARIKRDFYNQITRLDNCEIANEVKTQKAAKEQLDAIEVLEKKKVSLTPSLQEAANLRKQSPDASLNELCELYEQTFQKAISKSGMKHRLAKLKQLAAELMVILLIFTLTACQSQSVLKKQTFTIELGQDVFANPALYVKTGYSDAARIEPITKGIKKQDNRFVSAGFAYLVVGLYDFVFEDGSRQENFAIKIKDTKPPTLGNASSDINVPRYTTIDWATIFEATDLSGVTYSTDANIDTTMPGSQLVKVRIADRFGNATVKEVNIHVV